MTLHQIADAALIASQLFTLFSLRKAIKRGNYWHAEWVRQCSDNFQVQLKLFHWERNAVLRDPKTGRYVKKVTT